MINFISFIIENINFSTFIIGVIFGMVALLLYAYIIDKIDDRKFRKKFDEDYIKLHYINTEK